MVGSVGDGEGADVGVECPVAEGVGVVEFGIGERGGGGGERGVFGAVVGAAIDPVVALAVFEGETGVVGRCAGGGSLGRVEIGVGGDFEIAGEVGGGVERQRQLGQRHGRVDDSAGGDGVVEGVGGVLAQDLVGGHGRAAVVGIGVLDEDAGEGGEAGAGGDVEIVAQGVGAAGEHEGVLFVGVIAGLGGVVLVVDDALGLGGGEVAGAGVGGEDDLGFVGAVGDGVAADFGRGVEVGEFAGGGGDFFEPPNGELVGVAGEGVDGDNRSGGGGAHADGEGVFVGGGGVGGAAGDVAGHAVITGGWGEALADVDGAGEGGGVVAFEVAVAALGLGHEADVPDAAVVAGEFEQSAVDLVAGEADEQALGKGVEHGLVLLFVVLVDDGGDGAVFEFEAGAGGGGAAVGGDGVVGESGDVVGPDLQVFVQVFGPVEFEAGGEAGGGENAGVEGFEPVEDDAVFEGVFAFGVVGEGAVGAHGAGIVGGGVVGVAAVDGEGDEIGLVEGGADFVAEGDAEGGGGGGLGDLDDVGPEEFVGAVVAQGAEVFDEEAAGDVVGVEFADAVGFLEPDGAQFGGGLGVGIGGGGGAGDDVFGGDGGREAVAVNGVYRDDAAAGDGDARAVEAFFGPVEAAYRAGGGGGNGEGFENEDVVARAIGDAGAPPELNLTGLVGEDGAGVGAVVERFVNAGGEGGDDDAAGVGDEGAGGILERLGAGVDGEFAGADGFGAPEVGGGGDDGAAGVEVAGGRRHAIAQEVARDAGGEGGADDGAIEQDGGSGRIAGGEGAGVGAGGGAAGGFGYVGVLVADGGVAGRGAGAADGGGTGAFAEFVEDAAFDLVLGKQGRGEEGEGGTDEQQGAEGAGEAHGEGWGMTNAQ